MTPFVFDPVELSSLRSAVAQADATEFSKEVFDVVGVFVVRGAIPEADVVAWQSSWRKFQQNNLSGGRKVNPFNPVSVAESPPAPLSEIHRHPALLDIIEQAFGPDIALYNQRFVIKDAHSRGPVFLHQDFPYHLGWPTKASAFVPLSEVSTRNGGLIFHAGTHRFGYLGDAGEINREMIPTDWPVVAPTLNPGDVALMNSLTWHESAPHVEGPDRVIADIIYQPANDPTGVALLRGRWRTQVFLSRGAAQIFSRSRVTKLTDLQRELDALRSEVTK